MSLTKRITITALAAASLALTVFVAPHFPAKHPKEPLRASSVGATEAAPTLSMGSPPSTFPATTPAPFTGRTAAAAALEELRRVLPSVTENVANWKEFKPAAVTIAPYPDLPLEFTATSIREEYGRTIWTGRNEVQGAYLVAAATENEWHATLVIPGANTFEVFISGGNVTLTEKDHDAEICGHDAAKAMEAAIENTALLDATQPAMAGDVHVVDVLFFYDAETLAQVQGHASTIETRAIAHLESGNTALQNSEVANLMWRFVGAYQVPAYAATSEMENDLELMSWPNNDLGRFVREKILLHGADQAVLYVGGNRNWGGIAYALPNPGNPSAPATSVVRWGTTDLTLVHELGHNYGCFHDRETDEQAFDGDGKYHYGHRFRVGSNELGTIMSYATKVRYFSNPAVTFNGHPVGVAEGQPRAANNARKVRENAPAMANRREGIAAPAILVQPQSVTVVRGNRLDLTVTASGGNLEYQWRRGGVIIPGATAATFTRVAVVDADAGSYTVTVTNAVGAVTSVPATVTVTASVVGDSPAPAATGAGGGGGGGGGGATNPLLIGVTTLLLLLRAWQRRTQ